MESGHNDGIKLEGNEHYNLLSIDAANQGNTPGSTTESSSSFRSTSSKQRWNESPEARARRLARNAERMRERRARESEDEYRARLARNAEANRMRRHNENEVERAMRLVRNAARQRLRRAMETPDQRSKRLAKLAERMRIYRANETPEQRKMRLAEMAARARERIARESSEERKERLRKLSEYAKKVRSNKNNMKTANTNESNQNLNQNTVQNVPDTQIGGQQTSQPQQPNPPTYPHQTLTNSIEYYQNMFINSALRPNITKDLQTQLNVTQNSTQLPVRFTNNTHGVVIDPSVPTNIFQQNFYDDSKPVQKIQQVPYQTLTSSIEYYQNKFIKGEKVQQDSKDQSPSEEIKPKIRPPGSESSSPLASHQQLVNPTTQLYNQFPYLNNFPPVSSPPSSSNSQQNYYPMYHNGFQLAIAPNTIPPPFTPVHFQNAGTIQQPQQQQQQAPQTYNIVNASQQAQNQQQLPQQPTQLVQDFPKPVRGRPKKIFPDNEITRIPAELQDEAIRQYKVNALLENEINQILASPKRGRGRPGRGHETEEERRIRLDKMAAHQRQVRANETLEEREIRLRKLSERARLKRQQIRETETEEERRVRRAKQAEYARLRRLRAQTPENKKRIEERAKQLYAQIHSQQQQLLQQQQQSAIIHGQQQPQSQQPTMHQNQPHTLQMAHSSGANAANEDFVKNPGKDFAQSENNDVLKILEPIIIMKAK